MMKIKITVLRSDMKKYYLALLSSSQPFGPQRLKYLFNRKKRIT